MMISHISVTVSRQYLIDVKLLNMFYSFITCNTICSVVFNFYFVGNTKAVFCPYKSVFSEKYQISYFQIFKVVFESF